MHAPSDSPYTLHLQRDWYAAPVSVLLPTLLRIRYPEWTGALVWHNQGGGQTWRMVSPTREVRYLKTQPPTFWPPLHAEVQRLRWAAPHLPVPPVIETGHTDGVDWMITAALPGQSAHLLSEERDARKQVSLIAGGLRQFHAAPVQACPYSFVADVALDHVQRRVDAGLIDPARHFHPENAHFSVKNAITYLRQNRPVSEDLVVCHGDFCAPNILTEGDRVTGFVDLGELGVADRWWDLAVAGWSVGWNFSPDLEALFYSAYGIHPDPGRIQWYRLLYDMVS